MDITEQLRELARNLYWTWHPDVVEIFRDLDPVLWRQVNHNPVAFLSRLSTENLDEKASELALDARIHHAFHVLKDHLASGDTWGSGHAGPLRAQPVAYFSAEFGLHESLPIYSGGLGILAGDHLKGASDLGIPLVGIGLFYAKGYFNQRLNSDGWQEEDYFSSDVDTLPMQRALDADGRPLCVSVRTKGSEIFAAVWTALVGRCRLILLDSQVDQNSPDDQRLTAQLYGGDRNLRIRQELLLGVGGLRAVHAMGLRPGVIHMNEGHSAFAVLELARTLMERDGRSFDQVREKAAAMTIFTTHTPVAAGHDRFEPAQVQATLSGLREQLGISTQELLALGRLDPEDENETFCMTVLGMKMSRKRNAVSALHAAVSRAMWRSLWPQRDEHEVPIGYITNGIHVRSWLAAPMARLYDRCLGTHWTRRMDEPQTWAAVDRIDEVEFWEHHQILKTRLFDFVRRRLRKQAQSRGEHFDASIAHRLDPMHLTIGFARRFASYKRADLLMGDMDRLDRLVNNPKCPVQLIYAGKAHPADDLGKKILQRVFEITRDPRFAGKIILLEDYDINVGRHLVQGVDVWLNTPRRPFEACGTSGQKVVLNGGLNLSILDGWWAEGYDGYNGFAFGGGGEHVDPQQQDESDRRELYEVLENQVVDLFYKQDSDGVPQEWVARQKHALQTLAWRFSARRMMLDYTNTCYLPAIGGLTAWFPNQA